MSKKIYKGPHKVCQQKKFSFIMFFLLSAGNNHAMPVSLKKICLESCQTADGKTLKECFKKLSHEERIQFFDELSFEQKDELFKSLDFLEYENFLDDFNEYEWKRIIKKIPPSKRCYWWTKPIYKQRALIQKAHIELLREYTKRKKCREV